MHGVKGSVYSCLKTWVPSSNDTLLPRHGSREWQVPHGKLAQTYTNTDFVFRITLGISNLFPDCNFEQQFSTTLYLTTQILLFCVCVCVTNSLPETAVTPTVGQSQVHLSKQSARQSGGRWKQRRRCKDMLATSAWMQTTRQWRIFSSPP